MEGIARLNETEVAKMLEPSKTFALSLMSRTQEFTNM